MVGHDALVITGHSDDIDGNRCPRSGGVAAGKVAPVQGMRDQDRVRLHLLRSGGQRVNARHAERGRVRSLGDQDVRGTKVRGLRGGRASGAGCGEHQGNRRAGCGGSAEESGGCLLEFTGRLGFDDDEDGVTREFSHDRLFLTPVGFR